jgi:hypothetical protein
VGQFLPAWCLLGNRRYRAAPKDVFERLRQRRILCSCLRSERESLAQSTAGALPERRHDVMHLMRSARGLPLDLFDRRKGCKRNFRGRRPLGCLQPAGDPKNPLAAPALIAPRAICPSRVRLPSSAQVSPHHGRGPLLAPEGATEPQVRGPKNLLPAGRIRRILRLKSAHLYRTHLGRRNT